MITDVILNFNETVALLDELFPSECWYSNFENIIKGDTKGLPRIQYTVCPEGPIFHLASIASFALEFAEMNSYSATEFIEQVLENIVYRKRIEDTEVFVKEIENLLGVHAEEGAA